MKKFLVILFYRSITNYFFFFNIFWINFLLANLKHWNNNSPSCRYGVIINKFDMNISISEILVVVVVAMCFFKPQEIRDYAKSFFKSKKTLESEVDNLVKHVTDDEEIKKIEFFDVEKCKKYQKPQ